MTDQEMDIIQIPGENNIENEVIGAIAGEAAKHVDGVGSIGTRSFKRNIVEKVSGRDPHARGIAVEAGKKNVILDLDLVVLYGYNLSLIHI